MQARTSKHLFRRGHSNSAVDTCCFSPTTKSLRRIYCFPGLCNGAIFSDTQLQSNLSTGGAVALITTEPQSPVRRYEIGREFLYKGILLDAGYRLDLVVEDEVIVEIKAVAELLPVHEAQLRSYLKQVGRGRGLLINFNTKLLKHSLRRLIVTPLIFSILLTGLCGSVVINATTPQRQ